ncbi:MAG: DeoR/GlpR family DNA-binding transcription regulator [Opitutaceae bacterium]
MFAHERQKIILDILRKRSRISVPELQRTLQASPATVRRDLTFLEELGKIVRTHGGVMQPQAAEVPFDRRSRAAHATKKALAQAAVALAKSGDVVFVDAGTTTLEVGRRLLAIKSLTVVTNSIPLLQTQPAEGARLIALGGEVRSVSRALVGAGALEWVRTLNFNLAFLGTSGIDVETGPTTTELSEAGVKGAIARKADLVAVLADKSKWDRPAMIGYCGWNEVDHLFISHTPTDADHKAITRHGTRIHVIRH